MKLAALAVLLCPLLTAASCPGTPMTREQINAVGQIAGEKLGEKIEPIVVAKAIAAGLSEAIAKQLGGEIKAAVIPKAKEAIADTLADINKKAEEKGGLWKVLAGALNLLFTVGLSMYGKGGSPP